MTIGYPVGRLVARLREPEPPPYGPVSAIVLATPQLDGSVVRLGRSAAGVWRIDVIREGRAIYTRTGGRSASDLRMLVKVAQQSARDRGSEILVCPYCHLPLSATKETTTLCRSSGALAHVDCPDLFDDRGR